MQADRQEAFPVLAVDLGGTKILSAIVTPGGDVLASDRRDTQASEGKDAVIARIKASIDSLLTAQKIAPSRLQAIVIAAAGVIDMEHGVVTNSPNLPGWEDVPLGNIIRKEYGIPTLVINDAKAAAIGEHQLGAGKGARNLVFVTVSTGIGSGIIIDGKLYFGASGGAGEIGHMTIDASGPKCACGNTGCLEALASGTAVARDAIERIRRGEESALLDAVGGRAERITAKEVFKAARAGDHLAASVVESATKYLGIGMVNLVNLLNPEIIVVGGGLSREGDFLLNPVRNMVKNRAFPHSANAVRIVAAALGDDAGVIGAALFAFEKLKKD